MDDIRKEMLSKRRNILPREREKMNREIFKTVTALDVFKNAKRIFAYINTPFEAETEGIILSALKEGKEVFLPVCRGEDMVFIKIEGLGDLKMSNMGIREPEWGKEAVPKKGDLFIIPGSVFDKNGHRYGYGKGFYDRYLSSYDVVKTALCYDFQLVEEIKTQDHDVDMDIVVTDKQTLYVKGA